jgi:hypothetical protein
MWGCGLWSFLFSSLILLVGKTLGSPLGFLSNPHAYDKVGIPFCSFVNHSSRKKPGKPTGLPFESLFTSSRHINTPLLRGHLCVCGEGGIRTLDTVLKPYGGLANRYLQPLGHLTRNISFGMFRVAFQPPRKSNPIRF